MTYIGLKFLNDMRWLPICALLVPFVASAEKVAIELGDGDIAIVVPAIPTQKYYPDNIYEKIRIYTNKDATIQSTCRLCPDTVNNCRSNPAAYCMGSVDVVFRSVLPVSIVDTRDKHSPDTCYRQFCWAGGACKTVSYTC